MGKYDRGSPRASRGETASPARGAGGELRDNIAFRQAAEYLSTVRFRKKAVGGLDPADVWRKLEELNRLYEDALLAERVRYNLLIRQLRLDRLMGEDAPEEADGEA